MSADHKNAHGDDGQAASLKRLLAASLDAASGATLNISDLSEDEFLHVLSGENPSARGKGSSESAASL